jgi:hypothetical protein
MRMGLRSAHTRCKPAQEYLADPGKGPLESEYAVADEKVGRGRMAVLLGDYFDDAWLREVQGWEGDEGFDIIYDNTVCFSFGIRVRWYAVY